MTAPLGADCSRLGGLTWEGTVISNMPLLFADGFPTCLDIMTDTQLEKFIPFMIHCALGVNPYENARVTEIPVWWPCTIAFKFPLRRPACFASNEKWMKTLKSLVTRCYDHHECLFMLTFSDELMATPTTFMKFVDLNDGTTELRDKRTGKLLVTFRNENRLYDRVAESPRRPMQLLPRSPRPEKLPIFTDIYLCESCDAEFETLEQVKSHEVTCHTHDQQEEEDEEVLGVCPETLDHQGQFLGHLDLMEQCPEPSAASDAVPSAGCLPVRSPRRVLPKRSRQGSLSFAKCTSVPVSSPMGRMLLRQNARPTFTGSPLVSDRTERYCSKPFKMDTNPRLASTRNRCLRTTRQERWAHSYSFSANERRQRFATIDTGLDNRSRNLLVLCKTPKVVLQRLSNQEIASYTSGMDRHNRVQPEQRLEATSQPTQEQTEQQQLGAIPIIDLCNSSDDEAPPGTPDSFPPTFLHELSCVRSNRHYFVDRATPIVSSDSNVHLKIDPVCIQKRVKNSSVGPSENRVIGIPFTGRKSSTHKLFHLLEPDSKGKLKELNKIKKSHCIPPKVNLIVKCGESR